MRVMSIGNVYPPHHLGGYEVIWQGVNRHLAQLGNASRVLTTDHRAAGVAEPDAEDVHRELRWYWHDHEWPALSPMQRLCLERHNARIFDRHLHDFRPDLIAWWPVGGMSLSLIEQARRARLPSLLFVLDYWPEYGPQRDLWTRMWSSRPWAGAAAERLTGLPTRPHLGDAGRWLFCSETMRNKTLALGIQIPDQAILAPGIERPYLELPPESEPPAWEWRLLYIGRVVEQKGVATAVQALAALPEAATLRIVGPGDEPYRRELEALAERLGVAGRVRFDPPQPRSELFGVYRACDAVVFPVQWEEPFGLVPLEAMACGRPVLATGRGGSGDFLEHERNSLLFEAGDAAGLAAAVTRLAAGPGLRERLRAGGLTTAARHGEDQFNRRAVEEMESLLTRRSARSDRGAPASTLIA